jgi:hypothetical protein
MTRRQVVTRATQALVALLAVGLAVRSLLRHWTDFRAEEIALELDWLTLGAAAGAILVVYVLLIEAWRRIVIAYGQRLPYAEAARIWLLASLGKYVPGKVWAVAAAAVLAKRAGVEPAAAVGAAFIIQALVVGSGVVVVLAAWPGLGAGLTAALMLAGILTLVGTWVLTSPGALDRVQRPLPAQLPRIRALPAGTMALAFGINLVAWLGYGLAFWLMGRGLVPDLRLSWSESIVAFCSAYIVGLVAAVTPAGIGPRESVFILMLTGAVGPKLAVGLALASRVLWTTTEIGAALPFVIRRQSSEPSSGQNRIP